MDQQLAALNTIPFPQRVVTINKEQSLS